MKLVMTLLVRDEADILDAQLAFHLNAGVDFVIATDHRSQDGTTEILERYARDGYLHMLREQRNAFLQAQWVTPMARMAATDFGADWVINADADEFWWPRGGTLKEILASVPRRFGMVRCFERHFVPRPGKGHFVERMTIRVTPQAEHGGDNDPFQPGMQVAHRGHPSVRVAQGNHDAQGDGLLPLRGWYPFEVLHFPLRSLEQSRRKFTHKLRAEKAGGTDSGGATRSAWQAIEAGTYNDWYARRVVDEATAAGGLADGTLMIDTRLRDALRHLVGASELAASGELTFALPDAGIPRLEFISDDLVGDALYAHEVQPLDALDAQLRIHHRVNAVESRVIALRRGFRRGLLERVRGAVRGREA